MKRFTSKMLAAIVACSATVLLGGINVHAASNGSSRVKPARPVQSVVQQRPADLRSKAATPDYRIVHHFNYRSLNPVRSHQTAAFRLGARHGRRTPKARNNHRRTANRHARRQGNRRRVRKPRRSRAQKRTSRRHAIKYPSVVKPHERVVNQRRSAVNRFKKRIAYVNNQKNPNFNGPEEYGDSDYGRKGVPIRSNNTGVVFHRLTFLPKTVGDNQFYSPQGLVIASHYAYVITNATNSYESDAESNRDVDTRNDNVGSSPYRLGASQIVRINLSHHVKDYNNNKRAVRRDVKVGSVFYGGHGQGFTENPRTSQLWLLNNPEGQVTKTAVSLINPRTLLPMRRINFRFGDTTIGDDLAFDRRGQALNVTEAGNDSFAKPGSIKFFRGVVNPSGVRMSLVKQALRWAPTQTIQGLAYNQHNGRLYILGDDSIVSLPESKLGHLKTSDVKLTTFNTTREFEGLSFDKRGHAYLLVSRSPEILVASEFE